MKSLIYSHFIMNKTLIIVSMCILSLYAINGVITSSLGLGYIYIIELGILLICNSKSILQEEKSKFTNRELTFDKKTFVKSRYAIILIYSLSMLCINSILLFVSGEIKGFNYSIVILSFFTILLIISVPIVLKYGARQIYTSFPILFILYTKLRRNIPRSILEIEFIKYLYVTDWIQYVFLIIATLVCYLISIRISYKILDVK